MNRPKTSAFVCLVYLLVCAWFGAAHHHQDLAGTADTCAACAWQNASLADAPVTAAIVLPQPEAAPAPEPSVSSPAIRVPLANPDRGPPCAA